MMSVPMWMSLNDVGYPLSSEYLPGSWTLIAIVVLPIVPGPRYW